MEVIGVTIGIGDRYFDYAQKSAALFKKNTGIDVRIIDGDMFDRYDLDHVSEHFNERTWYMKLLMFDLFPEVENIIYFDCDWMATNKIDFKPFLNKPEFHCVRDRIFEPAVKEASNNIEKDPNYYFNAGFYIVNRTHHKEVYEYAKKIYIDSAKQWGDQCVTNRAINDLNTPIFYLGKEYNFMDINPESWVGKNLNIKAIHTSATYPLYEKGESLVFDNLYTPDRELMELASERYKLEVNDSVYQLFPDGFTSGPCFWFKTKNLELVVYDLKGERTNYSLIL